VTIALSFGAWGGFYVERGEISWRVCLGWIALTLLFEDLDVWLERYVDLSECHDDHYRCMLAFGREAGALRAALEKIAFDVHAPSRDDQGNSMEWYAEQAELWAQQALDDRADARPGRWAVADVPDLVTGVGRGSVLLQRLNDLQETMTITQEDIAARMGELEESDDENRVDP